jgi:hypothetical protein
MKLLFGLLLVATISVGCTTEAPVAPTQTPTLNATATPAQVPLTPTPQSNLLPAERDTHAAVQRLASEFPQLPAIVELVEREDVQALLGLLVASERLCEKEFYRGEDGCSVFEVPRGTMLEFVQRGEGPALGRVLRSQAEEQFTLDLVGKSPTLELVARERRTHVVLIFDLESEDIGQFIVEYDPAIETVTRAEGRTNVMPLDFIRVAEHGGADVYEVLAAADSFHEKEAAFIRDSIANQTALPYDYPWWRAAGVPSP